MLRFYWVVHMNDVSAFHTVVLSTEAIAYVQSRKAAAWKNDPEEACRLVVLDRRIDLLALPAGAIWKAVPKIGKSITLSLAKEDAAYLESMAEALGYDVRVVLQNLIEGGPFDPAPANKTGLLRTEYNRGRIYGFYMEMPGYQYSFLREIGDTTLSGRDVLDEAIVALAEKLLANGEIRGVHPPQSTMDFAYRLIDGHGLLSSPAKRPINRTIAPISRSPRRAKTPTSKAPKARW